MLIAALSGIMVMGCGQVSENEVPSADVSITEVPENKSTNLKSAEFDSEEDFWKCAEDEYTTSFQSVKDREKTFSFVVVDGVVAICKRISDYQVELTIGYELADGTYSFYEEKYSTMSMNRARYDAVTREAIKKDEMRKFLKFVHDDVVYCKYYEVVYILFHTGMRISEFCGLTLKDIDLENKTVNIDHQLQRTSSMEYVIESTKTNAGTRVLPITDEVADMFRAIIEDRPKYKMEKIVGGYTGFLFLDKKGMPLVAMHWEHRFKSMVGRYNEIYKVQMPKITPHVCRHTYCSNMAKSGMNPNVDLYLKLTQF